MRLRSLRKLFRLRTIVGKQSAKALNVAGVRNAGIHVGAVHEITEGLQQWTAMFVHDLGPFADNIRPGQAIVNMVEEFLGHGQ